MKKPSQRRKSPRLQSWDYRFPAWYFITICTQNKRRSFGDIISSKITFSRIGEIANRYWYEIPSHVEDVSIDEHVIMPNHVHGILILQSELGSNRFEVNDNNNPNPLPQPKSLSSVIRSYKAAVTRWARSNGYPAFAWQPRFYDHIIRDEEDLRRIRKYIQDNPRKWELDEYFTPTR